MLAVASRNGGSHSNHALLGLFLVSLSEVICRLLLKCGLTVTLGRVERVTVIFKLLRFLSAPLMWRDECGALSAELILDFLGLYESELARGSVIRCIFI